MRVHKEVIAHAHTQECVCSHLDRNVQLIPVLVRWGEAGSVLEGASGGSGDAGGRGDRLSGDLRKPNLQHHLHLEQSVQVLLPTTKKK